jgi:flagellar hook assembly protein FlgD
MLAVVLSAMLTFSGGVLTAFAANGISIAYIGQPDEPTSDKYNYATVIKFQINGYGGNRLNVEIIDEAGNLLVAEKSPLIKTNRAVWWYYWDGKSTDGLRYDDATYTINFWIEGRRKDTLNIESFILDLKGNSIEDNTSRTYMRLVYIGTPDNQLSPYFEYAFNVRIRYKLYKGETAKIRIYDPSGRYVSSGSAYINSNDYTHNFFWDGYDSKGNFCKDGKYTVTYWVDGFENYTNDSMVVTLRRPIKMMCKLVSVFNTGNREIGVMGFMVHVANYKNETLRAEITDPADGSVYRTYSYKIQKSNPANYTWYWDGKLFDGKLAKGGCVVSIWIENYYAGTYQTKILDDVVGDWDEEFP